MGAPTDGHQQCQLTPFSPSKERKHLLAMGASFPGMEGLADMTASVGHSQWQVSDGAGPEVGDP